MKPATALATVAVRLGGKASNFVAFILLARALSLDEFGRFGFAFSTALIISTAFDMGMRNSVAYLIGREPERAYAWIRATLFGFGIASALAVLVSSMPMLPRMFGGSASGLTGALAVATVGSLALRTLGGIPLGLGLVGVFNTGEGIARASYLASVVALVISKQATAGLALVVLGLSQLVGGLYMLRVGKVAQHANAERLPSQLVSLIRRGAPFMLSVLGLILSKRAALFVAARYGAAADLGHYFGALRVSEVLSEVALAVAVVIFADNVRSADRSQSALQTAASVRQTSAMLLALAVVGSLFAKPAVAVLLGSDFVGLEWLFRILLMATAIGSYGTLLFPSMGVLSTPSRMLLAMTPSLCCSVVFALIGQRTLGTLGLALADLLSATVLSVSFVALYVRATGLPARALLLPTQSEIDGIRRAFRLRTAP